MAYGDFLRELLQPLGVYDLSPGSFSAEELGAMGTALDDFWDQAQKNQGQTILQTATGQGLWSWEGLLAHQILGKTDQERREAIGAFLAISGDSFTPESLGRCLKACGLTVDVKELAGANTVEITFPDVRGEPENYARVRAIVEDILPCHLQINYKLLYCTWGDLKAVTWGRIHGLTWQQLLVFKV